MDTPATDSKFVFIGLLLLVATLAFGYHVKASEHMGSCDQEQNTCPSTNDGTSASPYGNDNVRWSQSAH